MRYGQTTILCFFAQRPETELRCKRESGTDFLLGIWRRAHMCSDAKRCDATGFTAARNQSEESCRLPCGKKP